MSSDRQRQDRAGSLELDYGDDMADLDYDQWSAAQVAAQNDAAHAQAQPIASTSTSTARTTSESKPATTATAATASASARPLPAGNGLPVNPLTGQRPTIAMPAPSTSSATGASAGPPSSSSSGVQQGTLAHTAVFVGEMHWWTSDRDVVELTQLAGIHGVSVKDVSFAEHKVNGKSKGVCYVECHSQENAQRVKTYVENNEFQLKKMTATLAPGGASTAPFRTLPKEPSRGGAPAPVPSGQVRIGNLTVRTPRPATTAYLEPHVGQNRRDQPPGTGPGAQLGGIRLGGFMPAPRTAGPGSYGQKGAGSNYHQQQQQQQNGGAGSAGPPLHMGMGMGLPMNPMLAQQQQQQQPNQQGGVFNPAFMNAAGGGNQAAAGGVGGGGFAFDPSAAFGMANFGMQMGMPGMCMGMPGMGAGGGAGGMPDFSQQMNMMGMGMGGMWPFPGMSPFGAGTAGGMSPMSNMSGQGDGGGGAGEGYETGGAKKRSRMDN